MNHFILCIECGSDKLENKELGLCATHNKERREKENAKPKVVKHVKKVSEKRAEELTQYPKLKEQYIEHKMVCEMKFQGCSITATDIHHTSLSDINFLNTNTWIGCCRFCHTVCENMPAEERRLKGYLTD
jgi:hypothetical protein